MNNRRFAALLALLPLSPIEHDALSRVVWAEAASEPDEGVAAVVHTILNRVEAGSFGPGVLPILDAPHQFEPAWRAGGWRNLPVPPPAFAAFVRGIVTARLGDTSGGATYFQNPRIVAAREAAGTVSSGLTGFGGMPVTASIGRHTFYSPTPAARRSAPPITVAAAKPPSVFSTVWIGGEVGEEGREGDERADASGDASLSVSH